MVDDREHSNWNDASTYLKQLEAKVDALKGENSELEQALTKNKQALAHCEQALEALA